MDLDMNMNENIERAFEELSVDINSDILDNVSAADTIETLNDTKKKKLTRDINLVTEVLRGNLRNVIKLKAYIFGCSLLIIYVPRSF